MDETNCQTNAYYGIMTMGKIWLNNGLVDRLAMLQQAEIKHPRINQVAIEKDWWVTVTLVRLGETDGYRVWTGGIG